MADFALPGYGKQAKKTKSFHEKRKINMSKK